MQDSKRDAAGYVSTVNVLLLSLFLLVFGREFSNASSFVMNADSTVAIYRVQVSTIPDALMSLDSAAAIKQQVLSYGIPTGWIFPQVISGATVWRVIVGTWPTRSEATTARNLIRTLGYPDALIMTKAIPVSQATAWNLPLTQSMYWQALSEATSQTNVDIMAMNGLSLYSTGLVAWSTATDTVSWLNAISYFAQVIQRGIDTTNQADARFMLGHIYRQLYLNTPKQSGKPRIAYGQAAIDALADLVNKYPISSNAALAQKEIGDCEHDLSDYYPSRLLKTAAAYKKVLTGYSQSTIAPEACLQYIGVEFELAESGIGTWDTLRNLILQSQQTYIGIADARFFARTQLMYGESYFYQGDYDRVLKYCQQIVKQYDVNMPDVAMAKTWIGHVYLRKRQYDVALAQFQEVLDLYSASSDKELVPNAVSSSLYAKAQILIQQNNITLGIAALHDYLTKYPNGSQRADAIRWLGSMGGQ